MLFSFPNIIKLYQDGKDEPFLVFTITCQHLEKMDEHTLKCDGVVVRYSENVYVVIEKT
jgi:hypothetical protein